VILYIGSAYVFAFLFLEIFLTACHGDEDAVAESRRSVLEETRISDLEELWRRT